MNLPFSKPPSAYHRLDTQKLNQKLSQYAKRQLGFTLSPGQVGTLGEKAPRVIHAVLPKLTAIALLFSPLESLFMLPSVLLGGLFYFKLRPGLLPEQLLKLKQATNQVIGLSAGVIYPVLSIGTFLLSRTRWAASMLAKPLQYAEWRAAKHYIRTQQKAWWFSPTPSVKRYRAITHASPHVSGAVGSVVGFKLGHPWATQAETLKERWIRHATSTLTGMAGGYTLGYGMKHAMLTQLKKLRVLFNNVGYDIPRF
ncbi:MAG: hypothetical protein ACKO37_10265 [Vampirovibrionales bacterium]